MSMSSPSLSASMPVVRVPAWVWAVAVLAVFIAYFLIQENGTVLSASASEWLHEVTHDGRHALGVPCH